MNFDDLVRKYGPSDADIASGLGTSRQLVRHWRNSGKISQQRQAWIQVRTKGKLRADEVADAK